MKKNSFSIVGVGASAGGLEAFMELLRHLPADSGMGFVLVQHLDPAHESALTQLLGRVAPMPVCEVTNGMLVEPNHVYVIPPNTCMKIAGGILKLHSRSKTGGPHLSIDYFFQSLAEDQHDRAIGVVLSGTATDGTLGLEAIKAEGGITFAQDEQTAKYDSMPRSAAAAGCVDFVLSPENIARDLVRVARHPYMTEARASSDPGDENGLKKILQLLRNHTGVDFSLYKVSTIQRRLTRRVVLNKFITLDAYANFLRGNTAELGALHSDMLISVTSFFRNPEAFEALKQKVFPKLIQQGHDDPVRVWVVGCSMGQEAYSLAMAFAECSEHASSRAPQLQIFATDLNEALLDKARLGLYPKSLVQDVSPERLRRFFVEEEGGYRVSKPIREMCLFARQNVLSDPPFSRMYLISCRNVLIYIEPVAQKKILPMLHYALKPGGFLFLGASEAIGPFTDLFECADKQQRIYSKKLGSTREFHLPASPSHPPARKETPSRRRRTAPERFYAEPTAQREADRLMVKQFAPPGVLISDELQILEFRGPTSAYLEPPTGKANFDVLKMAREGLMVSLRAAISKAKKENTIVRKDNVRFGQNDGIRTVSLEIIPLKNLKERCYLILFKPGGTGSAGQETRGAAKRISPRQESRRIVHLERELAETRDSLQSIQEQHDAADEKLQAANEELQSANEELQSFNEELETSKEELESTNEELTTVNEEMVNRNSELNRLNNDLNNLQTSVHLAIVLLGRDLTIRRFTPLAERGFNLFAGDVGRPMSSINHNLDFPDLEQFVARVIDTVHVEEREVRDKDGHWYLLRARPYMTLDNKIDGAVLVLVDINALKVSEQDASASRDNLKKLAEDKDELIGILTHDLKSHLGSIRMSAEGFRDYAEKNVDPTWRKAGENILRSSYEMLFFLNEFLANAAADRNLTVKLEPISLSDAVSRAIRQYQETAKQKDLAFHTALPREDTLVQADSNALNQVIDNLLSNAIKFSPPGKQIFVAIKAGDSHVECRIEDQGPGFTEDDKTRMFSRYGRLSARPTGSEPSVGLGLSIVKRLVLAMHGEVTCESTAGSGATLIVRLPKAPLRRH